MFMALFNDTTKYAIMELTQIDDATKEEKIYAYVAAKCELIKPIECILENGKNVTKYEVVFTWNENQENITPEYNQEGICTNSIVVDQIFTEQKPARVMSEELNNSLIKDIIKVTPIYELVTVTPKLRANLQKALRLQTQHFTAKHTEAGREA